MHIPSGSERWIHVLLILLSAIPLTFLCTILRFNIPRVPTAVHFHCSFLTCCHYCSWTRRLGLCMSSILYNRSFSRRMSCFVFLALLVDLCEWLCILLLFLSR